MPKLTIYRAHWALAFAASFNLVAAEPAGAETASQVEATPPVAPAPASEVGPTRAPAPATGGPAKKPKDLIEEWPVPGISEPSGVVYHAQRGTVFVVSDEGVIGEVSLSGELLSSRDIGGDLEGVTYDPSTGHIFVIREGHEIIFELDPDEFKLLRRFTIDRSFEDDPDYLQRGGNGVEGITFVPDPNHPEGGRFFAVNQFDPAVLVELHLPLRTSSEKFEIARIVGAHPVAAAPLSSLEWSPELGAFLISSALWRSVYVVTESGISRRRVRIPGLMQEGLTRLPGGGFIIAQDTGGLIKWIPAEDPFAMDTPTEVTDGSH